MMVDNNLTTYSYTSVDNTAQLLIGNNCPGTDLGTISKVELRAFAYGDGDDRIDLIPVFAGGDGDEHQTTPGTTPGSWGTYQDITNDTNHPSPWSWSDVVALDCKVEFDKVGKGGTMYCAKVEIRVTYTEPGEGQPTMKRWHGIPGMNFTGRRGGW